jgi:hypothetical protein
MNYEQIIENLQQVLLNQSRMLVDCQSRIRDLEAIIGVKSDIPDEVVYGYLDTVENGRIIHSDLISVKTEDQIFITSNKDNKYIIFTAQLNKLKNLKNIEIQFDQGCKIKPTIHLADKLEKNTGNRISIDEFRKFCFERDISVSFYDKNRGFYPDWTTIFT